MSQNRGRLQTRIARHIAFAVVVSLVLSTVVLVGYRHRSILKTMEASARTYASLISLPLANRVFFYGSAGTEIISQRVADFRGYNRDIIRLEVVSVTGKVELRAEGEDLDFFDDLERKPRIEDPKLLAAVRGLETVASRVTEADGTEVYRVVAPAVEELGRHASSLVATFSYENTNRQLRQAVWLSAFVLGVGLILTYRVSVILARSITRNVERLQAGVQRIEEGNLDERVEVDSRDEIEELAEAFNRMADELILTIERLREANRELETLDQAKVDLVANVSHELKTPLTALRGYLELMSTGALGELTIDALQATDVCLRNVNRLSVRVEELVEVSGLDRSMVPDLPREKVELRRVLEGVVDTFLPRLDEGGVHCVLDVKDDLLPLDANSEQIERVFLNLVDNAVKFTPRRGTIVVSAEPCDHERKEGVLVRVKDSGIGIPSSELLRVFDRFYQVDPSARRRFGGMGLGLSLVRGIVEAHRGTVWAVSEHGIGSTFNVWLPGYRSVGGPRGGGSDLDIGASRNDFGAFGEGT